MKLYNTMSGEKETFTADQVVRVYVCGVTPYDTTHAGHAFTYVSFDVLMRYLRYLGHTVNYTQNVTDIDDDILRRAKKVGLAWDELGRQQTELFCADMAALNVIAPDHYPHATEETPGMIEIVQDLIGKGLAYEKNGSVYFSVRADPHFGELAHIPEYQALLTIANDRGNYPDDPNKHDPLDFVLWQAAQPDEPTWPSPWGPGRPGWHIECSAMSMRYLGPQLDIHGGGSDLIFPHHACEIAQSENYTDKRPFVRYWMHTGMVGYEGEKMSKSLGNLVLVSKVLTQHSADALRLYLSEHHYREEWSYEDHGPAVCERLATRLREAVELSDGGNRAGTTTALEASPFRDRFQAAMDDDLNTPLAIGVLSDLAGAIESAHKEGGQTQQARDLLRTLSGILGLTLQSR